MQQLGRVVSTYSTHCQSCLRATRKEACWLVDWGIWEAQFRLWVGRDRQVPTDKRTGGAACGILHVVQKVVECKKGTNETRRARLVFAGCFLGLIPTETDEKWTTVVGTILCM